MATNKLGLAICKAIGVDPNTVCELSLTSVVGDVERVTVVHSIWNPDTCELDQISETWAPVAEVDA